LFYHPTPTHTSPLSLHDALPISKRSRLSMPALLALFVATCLLPVFVTYAANPSSGTLNPTTSASLMWTGTATGSATDVNTQEADCVEGQTCPVRLYC